METYQYIIVGGGIAGGRACQCIRKVDGEGSIALLTQEPYHPQLRPLFLTGYPQDAHNDEAHAIDLIQGVEATALDPAARTLDLADGSTLQYEKLLLAADCRALRLLLEGDDLEKVFMLRAIEETDPLHERAAEGMRALILGGGLIGAEVAAALTGLGMQVTEIFPRSPLLERVTPPELHEYLLARSAEHGVPALAGIVAAEPAERVMSDNGETADVEVVVMGGNFERNIHSAHGTAHHLRQEAGAVLVGEILHSGDPPVYAVGDIGAGYDKAPLAYSDVPATLQGECADLERLTRESADFEGEP